MAISEERLAGIEKRLDNLEQLLQQQRAAVPSAKPDPKIIDPTKINPPPPAKPKPKPIQKPPSAIPITQLLGWAGVAAMVLAAIFLIRLALDAGWLTPWRQIVIALLASVVLIGVGLRLRLLDQQYASFLPAGGVVVQFCAIYGAHLYYHLIGINLAVVMVVLICFLTLWLGQKFNNQAYALFAVVGSYLAPLLLPAYYIPVIDLAIYFSAWSVLYCAHAIWIGNRRTYLLAGYLALLGFQFAADTLSNGDWISMFIFQTVQFLIFVTATVLFSLRSKQAMNDDSAIVHFPLLLIFYALQYQLLQAHIPNAAPWIGIASAAVLLLAHFISRKLMKVKLNASNILVASYVALVLYHAGYTGLFPENITPWVGLLVLPLFFIFMVMLKSEIASAWPYKVLLAVIFAANYFRLMEGTSLNNVAAHNWLALIYAIELYVAYYLVRKIAAFAKAAHVALYAAHIALMIAAVHILDNRLEVSVAWSAIALVSLVISFKYRDANLGKSSLFILAISCAKVMLFDLSSATPLIRIGSLLVLGGTLYLGGWLYKKVDAMNERIEK